MELVAKVAFLPGIIQLVRLIYREPILETGHINLMTSHKVVNQLKGAGFRVSVASIAGRRHQHSREFYGALQLNCCCGIALRAS